MAEETKAAPTGDILEQPAAAEEDARPEVRAPSPEPPPTGPKPRVNTGEHSVNPCPSVVSTEDPIAREIETVVSTMLEQMEIRSRVKVEKSGDEYYANIRPLVSKGLLIGRKGTTLKSIQYLARLIIKRKYPDVPPVMVDVGGYRHRREEFLCKKAEAVATVVTQNGREMSLDLLTEKERAIVEEHLKQFPAVRVYAVPAGSKQNVIIAPK